MKDHRGILGLIAPSRTSDTPSVDVLSWLHKPVEEAEERSSNASRVALQARPTANRLAV
jgi:hypothetical protein